ncbi:MAG TPA: LytTR family DNA-binding domain-containing protein [Mucilaginibacter sp.]|nr:LytTR family DNA-binding domain-containing protein [Mucilaginibacter sp.]
MKIDCLIVDDEPVARSIIRNYCSHLPFLNILGECGNALDAKAFLSNHKPDLLFLDINMPVLNGISFLNTLKHPPQVIFTTAYQEYAVSAFDLAACDYLLKPFSLERFIIAVDKAKEILQRPANPSPEKSVQQDYFFIRAEGKVYKIDHADCMYAEARGNYTKVVTTSTSILTKMSFSAFVDILPAELFLRIHRSFVVNKAAISRIEGNRVFIRQHEVPIAANYRATFLQALGL